MRYGLLFSHMITYAYNEKISDKGETREQSPWDSCSKISEYLVFTF